MSIVCAVKKNAEIAIASDSLHCFGSIRANASHMKNHTKIVQVNDSMIGLVGWNAVSNIFEHLITKKPEWFKLDNRFSIFETLIKIHKVMKDSYFIETNEDDDQPVESNQLDALIINKHGLFEIGSYREVNEYNDFWAIGSGRKYALGALQALYNSDLTATEIAEAGVKAAAEFDDACALPLYSKSVELF